MNDGFPKTPGMGKALKRLERGLASARTPKGDRMETLMLDAEELTLLRSAMSRHVQYLAGRHDEASHLAAIKLRTRLAEAWGRATANDARGTR